MQRAFELIESIGLWAMAVVGSIVFVMLVISFVDRFQRRKDGD